MNKSWMLILAGALLGAGSSALTVSAAPSAAYQLTFTTQPVNTTVGANMASVVVQLRAQNGTNVLQSGTAVSLALNKGTGLMGITNLNTDSSGKATFTNLNITLAGNGNTLLATASSLKSATSSVFAVSQGKTTVTVTASTNFLVYGQSVTFTATVSPIAPATGRPSGTVTFKDGNTILGAGTLNASRQAALAPTGSLPPPRSIRSPPRMAATPISRAARPAPCRRRSTSSR